MQPNTEKLFAQRIRDLREEAGISQTTLAARLAAGHGLKLDGTAITRMEKGTRSIRLSEAVAIASAFDFTVDEMLRPALTPDEQVRQAEEYADRAALRAAHADGEAAAATARLERLRQRLA